MGTMDLKVPLYLTAAAALGAVWYGLLLIPLATREMLIAPATQDNFGIRLDVYALRTFLLTCAVSLVLALSFRRFIIEARTLFRSMTLALLLPLLGTVMFAWVFLLISRSTGAQQDGGAVGWLVEFALTAPLSVEMVVTQAFYIVLPMGMVSQHVMARIGRGESAPVDRRLLRVTAIVVVISGASMAWVKQTDGIHYVSHEMVWRYDQPAKEHPGTKHIFLTFSNYPVHGIGIYSKDLGDYLESLPSHAVTVKFRLRYHLRTMSSLQEVQIGDLTRWNAEWGYYRASGHGSSPERRPSPWHP